MITVFNPLPVDLTIERTALSPASRDRGRTDLHLVLLVDEDDDLRRWTFCLFLASGSVGSLVMDARMMK